MDTVVVIIIVIAITIILLALILTNKPAPGLYGSGSVGQTRPRYVGKKIYPRQITFNKAVEMAQNHGLIIASVDDLQTSVNEGHLKADPNTALFVNDGTARSVLCNGPNCVSECLANNQGSCSKTSNGFYYVVPNVIVFGVSNDYTFDQVVEFVRGRELLGIGSAQDLLSLVNFYAAYKPNDTSFSCEQAIFTNNGRAYKVVGKISDCDRNIKGSNITPVNQSTARYFLAAV